MKEDDNYFNVELFDRIVTDEKIGKLYMARLLSEILGINVNAEDIVKIYRIDNEETDSQDENYIKI